MAERRAAGRGAGPARARRPARVREALASRARCCDSDLPDSQYLEHDLARYFPPQVVERFGHLLAEHPLRRELIATIVANDVVNSQGVTFVTRLVAETGAQPADVVRAFRIARDVTGAVARWDDIEALDGLIDPVVQNELMTGVDWLVETTSRWYLVQARRRAHRRGGRATREVAFAELVRGRSADRARDSWREEHEQHGGA